MNKRWETAAISGDVESIRDLLERGEPVDSLDRFGQSALMLAARGGHREVCRLLVAAGADLNVTAKFGLSAMMLAVVNHHQEIALLLAHAGADRSLKGSGASGFFGRTAADLARSSGLIELADELEE